MNAYVADVYARIRAERPLIHQITNLVVMNDAANVTLHLGALPVMAHAVEDVAEIGDRADALVLNLGTLTPARVEAMLAAAHTANQRNTPIILDPVGAGATRLRTETALRLLRDFDVAIVRGNAAEIGALTGAGGEVKGVESVSAPANIVAVARQAAHDWGTVVAITGKRDIIASDTGTLEVDNGHEWLTTLTGTGCMATTVVAAFATVDDDPLLAAAGGLAAYGLAAELAAPHADGPTSFKVAFFDQLYNLTAEQVRAGVRITEL